MVRFLGWWRRRTRRAKARLVLYPSLVAMIAGAVYWTTAMPGTRHDGPLAPLDDDQRRLAGLLRRDVALLAGEIGERHMGKSGTLDRTWARIEGELTEMGAAVERHPYDVDGTRLVNLEVVHEGSSPQEIVVVGAHYDSAEGAIGADDNASGVAVLLELTRAFASRPSRRTIRFVAFVNEEPPHFQKESMGSLHYARACKERGDDVRAMISLESLGYYRDEPKTQKYPGVVSWFYPDRGDFVAFVGDVSSRSLVREAIGTFRSAVSFPSEGAALPSIVPGVGWSDQWSFWQVGYPGVMITDTAPFRNPGYHTLTDTPETLDYERLARVTAGLIAVVGELAR